MTLSRVVVFYKATDKVGGSLLENPNIGLCLYDENDSSFFRSVIFIRLFLLA